MAGVKGRTGKRSTIQDTSLLHMTTAWLVANWYTFSKEEKMKVALIVAPKGISDKHEHSGSIAGTTISVTTVNADRLQNNVTPNRSAEILNK